MNRRTLEIIGHVKNRQEKPDMFIEHRIEPAFINNWVPTALKIPNLWRIEVNKGEI